MVSLLRTKYPGATITSENKSVSGCDASCMSPQIAGFVQGTTADLIFFQIYGWEQPYATCVNAIRNNAPSAEIALVGNHVDIKEMHSRAFDAYMSDYFVPEYARMNRMGFVDLHGAWRRYLTNHGIKDSALMADGVHPNADGYWLMARMVLPWLTPSDRDRTPPTVASAEARSQTRVAVRFSEPVDSVTASEPANYTVSGATVLSATLLFDWQTVILATTARAAASQIVTVTGVRDRAPTPNIIGGSNTATVATAASYGWSSVDIGTFGYPGTTQHTDGSDQFTLTSFADNTNRYKNESRMAYIAVRGDCEIVARVLSLSGRSVNCEAGVVIREFEDYHSRLVMAGVKGGGNYEVLSRGRVSGSITVGTGASGATPPKYLRIVRRASAFTSAWSSDGVTWTQLTSATVAMGEEALAGVYVFAGRYDSSATATFTNVKVTDGGSAAIRGRSQPPRPDPRMARVRHSVVVSGLLAGQSVSAFDLRGRCVACVGSNSGIAAVPVRAGTVVVRVDGVGERASAYVVP